MSDKGSNTTFGKSLVALIVVPIISAGLSIVVTKFQSDAKIAEVKAESDAKIAEAKVESDAKDKVLEEKIQILLDKSNEFKKLRDTKCSFDEPSDKKVFFTRRDTDPNSRFDVADIKCSGEIRNLPKDVHLWMAIDIGGFIFFKNIEVEIDREKNTWSKSFTEPVEPGMTKELNLRLYAAIGDGHYQIGRWLAIGDGRGSYEKVTTISNTISVERVVGIRLQPKPR